MLTLNEITEVSFRKARNGYKPEDVDEFIDKVVESYDILLKKTVAQREEIEALNGDKDRLQKAVENLAEQQKRQETTAAAAPAPVKSTRIEPEDIRLSEECEYTQEEIKNALLNAEKLANATIRDARRKAEAMLTDANDKADQIVSSARIEVNEQKTELERLKKLVADFRASLLDKYKEHLKLVNALPTQRTDPQIPKIELSAPEVSVSAPASAAKPAPVPTAAVRQEVPAPTASAPAKKKVPQQTAKLPNLSNLETKEEMSQTQSFHLGNIVDQTGEFSKLKFGSDYDITKE